MLMPNDWVFRAPALSSILDDTYLLIVSDSAAWNQFNYDRTLIFSAILHSKRNCACRARSVFRLHERERGQWIRLKR
jgi:hypothetical protein